MHCLLGMCLLLAHSVSVTAESRVRRIAVNKDQIVMVRTALGIATIIQVPDRPNSIVVGDQEAFKVEYLDQAITIKPLHANAKSNLYVYTDYQRFNIALVTGGGSMADYVVYLDSPNDKSPETLKKKAKELKPSLVWMKFKASLNSDAIRLEVKRLGRAKDGVLIIEFIIRGSKKEFIKPEWIWITQNRKTKPIENLFLSSLELHPGEEVQGVIQVKRSEVDEASNIILEVRRRKKSQLTIPKVNKWR